MGRQNIGVPVKLLRIGYASRLYPEQRNIIERVPTAQYIFLRDFYSGLRRVRELTGVSRLFSKKLQDAEFKFFRYGFGGGDVLHLFNSINFGRGPWISTFETIIPRFRVALECRDTDTDKLRQDPEILRALDALSSERCKKIIAISDATARLQGDFLNLFPTYRADILNKQMILHPPQPTSAAGRERKLARIDAQKPIRFMLVGHGFFGKGGREVLHVLKEFQKRSNRRLEFIIVSMLCADSYATSTGDRDVQNVKQFIRENESWVTHHPSLSANDVLRLMEACDVGLLPSYAETYGYSVLEFQSMACPVVTTDIRAFPEINNNEVGWVIPIPKRPDGEARYRDRDGKERISQAIIDGLMRIVEQILEDPDIITTKGQKAFERIRYSHSPSKYALELLQVYEEAVNARV